eukprot:4926617-Pyramimonas_sp.AAC.3
MTAHTFPVTEIVTPPTAGCARCPDGAGDESPGLDGARIPHNMDSRTFPTLSPGRASTTTSARLGSRVWKTVPW